MNHKGMSKEEKLIIDACILTLRATLGNMSSREADSNVSSVIGILQRMLNTQNYEPPE